jgi:hypothetical protein
MAQCTENCHFVTLKRKSYRKIVLQSDETRVREIIEILKQNELFSAWTINSI